MISAAGNSNKFQKTRFWKEKSVEDVVALGPTAQATLINNEGNKYPTLIEKELKMYVSFYWNAVSPRTCPFDDHKSV